MNDIVIRLEEIHALGSNAYNTAQDKVALSAEATNLLAEMSRIAADAQWKGNHIIKRTAADTVTNTMEFGRTTSSLDIKLDAFKIPEVALGFNTFGDDIWSKINTATAASATGTAYGATIVAASAVTGYTETRATNPQAVSALAVDGAVYYEHLLNANQTKTVTADDDALSLITTAVVPAFSKLQLNGTLATTYSDGEKGVVLAEPTQLTFETSGSETAASKFTILGVGIDGKSLSESITLPTAAGAVTSTSFFKSVHSITKDGLVSVGNIKVGIAATATQGPTALAGSDIGSGSKEAALALAELKTVVDKLNIGAGTLYNKVSNVMGHMGSLNAGYQLDVSSKMDVDFAGETALLAKGQILAQAGTAMLAQANAQQQSVLALLQS
jgi:flagellin